MEEHPAKSAHGHEEKPDPWDDAPAPDQAQPQAAGNKEKPAPWDD